MSTQARFPREPRKGTRQGTPAWIANARDQIVSEAHISPATTRGKSQLAKLDETRNSPTAEVSLFVPNFPTLFHRLLIAVALRVRVY